MNASSSIFSALLALMAFHPAASHEQPFQFLVDEAVPASPRHIEVPTLVARNDTLAAPSKDNRQDHEPRPARGIKQFTAPTVQLRGTAEDIGLDSRTLASLLEAKFLQEFTFLQNDFSFEKTYETWEIGLFDCEVWTVGSSYPIALHIQCTGGSMDEPRHWHYATLGYGPKEKIADTVTKALDSIVGEYAAFVRKANAKMSLEVDGVRPPARSGQPPQGGKG
jgi:hypothetical protein